MLAASCASAPSTDCVWQFPAACVPCQGDLMLLVIDVGNTNTVLGVYELNPPGFVKPATSGPRMIAHWRVATIKTHTVDEYGVLFRNLFAVDKIETAEGRGMSISSLVLSMESTL